MDADAALALYRSALAKLHDLALERDAIARRRVNVNGQFEELNERIRMAREEARAARAALRDVLAQPEES